MTDQTEPTGAVVEGPVMAQSIEKAVPSQWVAVWKAMTGVVLIALGLVLFAIIQGDHSMALNDLLSLLFILGIAIYFVLGALRDLGHRVDATIQQSPVLEAALGRWIAATASIALGLRSWWDYTRTDDWTARVVLYAVAAAVLWAMGVVLFVKTEILTTSGKD